MGTNFYANGKIDTKCREKLMSHVERLADCINTQKSWCDLEEVLYDIKGDYPERIHLGKRSAGWQFLWNCNGWKYYQPTLDSIKKFLKDKVIFDEYGEIFTVEQFLSDELSACLYKKEGLLDGSEEAKYRDQFFYSDGLRFSLFTEFF